MHSVKTILAILLTAACTGCTIVNVSDPASGKRSPWKTLRAGRPVDQVLNPAITPDGRAYAYNYLVKTAELYVADGIR